MVFFGSSRIAPEGPLARYYEDARDLARRLTEWSNTLPGDRRFVVCSGGGSGIMEAANRGAADAGGRTIGLNIGLPHRCSVPNPYVTPELCFEFHYFFMRKLWFSHLARALIVFPGGFGTLDELMEMLTLTQTRKLERDIPIVLYGSSYWNEVIDFEAMVRHGVIDESDLRLFSFADDPETALHLLQGRLPTRPETDHARIREVAHAAPAGGAPMIELAFIGAAQTVTGSKHLLRTSRASVLLDCGLFQGRRRESFEKNRNIPIDVDDLDAVVLSHAHIDHSGALPLLCRNGYQGPVYATPATRDLAAPMLLDAAMIQDADARYIARLIERGEPGVEPVEPLYGEADVAPVLAQMVGLPYHQRQLIAPGVAVTFLDAGHVLGSAIVVLDVEDEGRTLRLAFTGDLGRHHLPILRDPEVPSRRRLPPHREHLRRPPARPDRAAWATSWPRSSAAPYERGGKIVIPVVRARAGAGGRLRAQAAQATEAASRSCPSTSTRR